MKIKIIQSIRKNVMYSHSWIKSFNTVSQFYWTIMHLLEVQFPTVLTVS